MVDVKGLKTAHAVITEELREELGEPRAWEHAIDRLRESYQETLRQGLVGGHAPTFTLALYAFYSPRSAGSVRTARQHEERDADARKITDALRSDVTSRLGGWRTTNELRRMTMLEQGRLWDVLAWMVATGQAKRRDRKATADDRSVAEWSVLR